MRTGVSGSEQVSAPTDRPLTVPIGKYKNRPPSLGQAHATEVPIVPGALRAGGFRMPQSGG